MRKSILTYILITLWMFGYSQKEKVEKINKSKPEVLIEKHESRSVLNEAQAYKLLYQHQIDANDDILKTIFYALGGLGTAVLLVFGSNWYFNHQKVKDAMVEIDTKVKQIKAEFQTEITEKFTTIKSDLSTENSQNNASLLSLFNSKKDSLRTELKNDIQISLDGFQELIQLYNENTSQQFKSIKELIDEKVKNLNSQIELSEKRIDGKHSLEAKFIKRDILRQKADVAALQGHKNITLKACLDFALYDFREGMNTLFEHTSRGVIESLENVDFIYDDEKLIYDELIEYAKNDFPEIVSKMESLAEGKEIRKLK